MLFNDKKLKESEDEEEINRFFVFIFAATCIKMGQPSGDDLDTNCNLRWNLTLISVIDCCHAVKLV